MNCPFCGCKKHRVLDTRRSDKRIARRRSCRECGRTFTTQETPTYAEEPLLVQKRDGARRPFSPENVRRAAQLACFVEKKDVRPADIDQITQQVTDEITRQFNERGPVPTWDVGTSVLRALRDRDDLISWLRFLAVFLYFHKPQTLTRIVHLIDNAKLIGDD